MEGLDRKFGSGGNDIRVLISYDSNHTYRPPYNVGVESTPYINIRRTTNGRGLVVEGRNLYDQPHLAEKIKAYLETVFGDNTPIVSQYNPQKGMLHLSAKPADTWPGLIDESRIEEIARNYSIH